VIVESFELALEGANWTEGLQQFNMFLMESRAAIIVFIACFIYILIHTFTNEKLIILHLCRFKTPTLVGVSSGKGNVTTRIYNARRCNMFG